MRYRCKHAVEAMRWTDTDENREKFSAWFDTVDAMFETLGPIVVLPDGMRVKEGEWIVLTSIEFTGMDDQQFHYVYEVTT